ncbi:MAG: hypothetical protein ACYSSO_00540 [Planctomycetota bacterium]
MGVEFSCGDGGGVDIIIHHVENVGLPVGEAGGAHCARTKEVYGMVGVSKRTESFSVCGRFTYLVSHTSYTV